MNGNIKGTIKDAFIKLTSIAEKAQSGDITRDQMRELVQDLIQNSASRIHQHRVSRFVTDN